MISLFSLSLFNIISLLVTGLPFDHKSHLNYRLQVMRIRIAPIMISLPNGIALPPILLKLKKEFLLSPHNPVSAEESMLPWQTKLTA